MLGNYKIRVNNEAESKEAQELFFELGYDWYDKQKTVKPLDEIALTVYDNGYIYQLERGGDFLNHPNQEITLTQLRVMVSAHRNNVNKSTPTYKQVIKYQSEDGVLFDTEQECINYHNERKLVNLLEDNIYALRHEDGSEVLDLMKKHKNLFLDYLQKI